AYGWLRRLFRVELPLAMPVIFAGLRVVTVSNIALVSVAVLIGSGALGELFDLGFGSNFYTPIIVGLVLTLALALLDDALILLIQRVPLPWLRKRAVAGTCSPICPIPRIGRAPGGSGICCFNTSATP